MTDGTNPPAGDQGQAATGGQSRIPDDIAQRYPDLEQLIMSTESMTPEERDYWFQILPIMTDQQIEKLRGILIHEREQLAKLDNEYEAELSKLNQKHVMEWKEQEQKESREALKQKEEADQEAEASAEADILKQLDSVDDDAGSVSQ
jgi:hypothetical protein